MSASTQDSRLKRRRRIRRKISGTEARPRLTVYKSLKHIYAQVIDDASGRTLVYVCDLDPQLREALKADKLKKVEVAEKVGELVARGCLEHKIEKVVFDRNGFPYHGRVSAVADAARKAGLKF
jgi:large subunit ribosomal protein L18